MNKRQLTKTFSFSKWFLFFFLAVGLTLSSCGEDYDDDISRLEELIKGNTASINDLKGATAKGHFVESITQSNGASVITLTNGVSYTITGSNSVVTIGDDGNWAINGVSTGKPSKGTNGTNGSKVEVVNGHLIIDGTDYGKVVETGTSVANSVVIIYDPASATYNVTRYEADGSVAETFPLGAAQSFFDGNTGVKFMPSYLSPGEAPRIHFPVIVSDTIINHNPDINWTYAWAKNSWEAGVYRDYGIIYSGKGEFRYQFNPHNMSFDAVKSIGFVRDTAEIWAYSNPNIGQPNDSKTWMMFNKKKPFTTGENYYDNFQYYAEDGNGVITKEKSYGEGYGILNFRAKDWQYAELNDISQRNVYSLRVEGNDGRIIHSDFVPAKFEVILQRDVYMVMKETIATKPGFTIASAPNTQDYRKFIGDDFYKIPQHAYSGMEYLALTDAQKGVVEGIAENKLYLGTAADTKSDPRIHVELLYQNEEKDLKEIVLNFFNNRIGKNPSSEYVLEGYGFDDYKLEFEPVDFYYQGVNQTKRYLNVTKDGIAKVKIDSDWSGVGGEGHTAAIDRTPIVRVKLVAPGEDNYRIVKTAIIKILIVAQKVEKDVYYEDERTVNLLHINQSINLDMDVIFNKGAVSKDEFRDIYDFVASNATVATPNVSVSMAGDVDHAHILTDRNGDVTLYDSFGVSSEYNQLVLTVTNTAFNTDHIIYTVKGTYVPKAGKNGPNIHLTYTVKVKYPKVPQLERSSVYWRPGTNINEAYGRYNERPVKDPALGVTDSYRMEAVLSNFFEEYAYPDYADTDQPRLTLSYELVDILNDASDHPHTLSGVKIIQRTKDLEPTKAEWVLLLANDDNGRSYIYVDEADARAAAGGRGIPIKVRAVVSFNECVDGLYGTCTARQDELYKFNKVHSSPTTTTPPGTSLVNGQLFDKEICIHPDSHGTVHPVVPYGIAAPEEGRNVVIEEFEVRFIDPVQFKTRTPETIYDKFNNKVDLSKLFTLCEYLYLGKLGGDHYIIYDREMANVTITGVDTNPITYTFDPLGWNPILTDEFVVNRTFGYEVVAYTHIDDGSKVVMGNNQKVVLDSTTIPGTTTLQWVNGGENIQRPFYIHVEICAKHKWGRPCIHGGAPVSGHSTTIIKVPVEKWN